jgi:hypothetical protein
METSDRFDRKRRRVKPKAAKSWAKPFIKPQTVKLLIGVGVWITRVLWLIYSLIKVFRE